MPKILVSEKEWLELGLRHFGQRGAEGLNIEEMARALGCAKSSFYWYFGSRQRYLSSLLRCWRETETRAFFLEAEQERTPAKKLLHLFRSVMQHRRHGDLLFHLRKAGEKNVLFRDAVAEIEADRIGYMARLLEELGDSKAVARQKAELIYNYYLGWYERHKNQRVDAKEVRRQLQLVARITNRGGR